MANVATEFASVIRDIENTGDFKVLRRMVHRQFLSVQPPDAEVAEGVIIDVETTGLNTSDDDVIQLGMLRFTYDINSRAIYSVGDTFERLRQPSKVIPKEVIDLTGITNEMVVGQKISPDEIEHFVGSAKVVIAFNAQFDRKFAERLHPIFIRLPWACAMSEVPWAGEGFDGLKLRYLLMQAGMFYKAHNALEDCFAVLELLARKLPTSGALCLQTLSEQSRHKKIRIAAVDSDFYAKDNLKDRGYRWHDDGKGAKFWWIDVDPVLAEAEKEYVMDHASKPGTKVSCVQVTAWNRYSVRASELVFGVNRDPVLNPTV